MTKFLKEKPVLIALGLLILPLAYALTLARTPILGDPTEYTVVAYRLGIAHPPGYAFMTLVSRLFQMIIPLGSIAWRTHWVGAVGGMVAAACVFGIVRGLGRDYLPLPLYTHLSALFAALTVGLAADHWQHAIHANPHILTAAFLAFNLFALTRWYRQPRSNRWLYIFAFSAGLGVTHHPLTVFAMPANGLFVLWVLYIRHRLGGNLEPFWMTALKLIALAALGMLPWLYFPLRAPALAGSNYPSDMNTLDGFLNLALARGLRVNLFHFEWTLAAQFDRLTVFWTLLRLQFSLPLLVMAFLGVVWMVMEARSHRPLAALYLGAFALNYAFVINTVQDVMAYLLGPFLMVGLFAGLGAMGLLVAARDRELIGTGKLTPGVLLLPALFLLGPILQLARNASVISLRHFDEGAAYVAAAHTRWDGSGEGAVLLNDWERMTPLLYDDLVDADHFDPADVRPILVTSERPWLDNVFDYLGGGPVYLSNFRRDVFDAGFRLRPRGDLWQVVEPGTQSLPPELAPVPPVTADFTVQIVAYEIVDSAEAGDRIALILAMTALGTQDIFMPQLSVGDLQFPFTTDSHLLTPDWQTGEIVVERFDFALPHGMAAGDYPLAVQMVNLTGETGDGQIVPLGSLHVTAQPFPPRTDRLLGNFQQQVGLAAANARLHGRSDAPWETPIRAQAGETIHITLKWQSLGSAEAGYRVFIHLIDLANRPIIDDLDYDPLGGASPTHLWFPKWLPGQTLLDPYQMQLPTDLPVGDYLIEVGMYEATSLRRLPNYDASGNMAGDRVILGRVIVE